MVTSSNPLEDSPAGSRSFHAIVNDDPKIISDSNSSTSSPRRMFCPRFINRYPTEIRRSSVLTSVLGCVVYPATFSSTINTGIVASAHHFRVWSDTDQQTINIIDLEVFISVIYAL
ncbi:hypothetical protein J6590_060041 [Homalodisca vitripennis]|nr:hypothetical protein J6590_060041 [Homalodisca vitripennis]